MAMEKLIRLDESAIGCTLAGEVKDGTGTIVSSTGDVLSWQLVRKLRRDGIDTVYVKPRSGGHKKQSVDERLLELDRKFARVDNDPVVGALKDIIAERMRRGSRGGT